MAPRDGDIRNSHRYVMSTAEADLVLLDHVEHMDHLRSVGRNRLQGDVVGVLIGLICWQVVIENANLGLVLELYLDGEALLAQLTLQVLPEVGAHNLATSLNLLALEPLSEALDVDESHGPRALTWREEWVIDCIFLLAKADSANAFEVVVCPVHLLYHIHLVEVLHNLIVYHVLVFALEDDALIVLYLVYDLFIGWLLGLGWQWLFHRLRIFFPLGDHTACVLVSKGVVTLDAQGWNALPVVRHRYQEG
jgi:hypothetical protein